MMNKIIKISLFISFLLSSLSVFAAACNTQEMPEELLKLMGEKKYDEAVKQAQTAYDKNKDDKQAAFVLARVYINATLRSGINIDLEKLGFQPGETGSKPINMDLLKQATSDGYTVSPDYYEQTDQFIREVVKRWPEAKGFYYCLTKIQFYSGDFTKFLQYLSQTAEFQRDNEAEAVDFLIGYANNLVQENRFNLAAEVYKTLLKTFPKSVPLLSSLGVIYIKRGFTQEAMSYFDKANSLDDKDTIVIGNIAEAAMLLAMFDKAEKYLLKKAEYNPERVDIYFDLAMNAMHSDPKVSIPYWEKYFKVNATHPDDENWVKNAHAIHDAVKKGSDDVELWRDLAEQMIQADVPKYAIPLLYYVQQKQPYDASLSFSLAHAYDIGGQYDLQEQALLKTMHQLADDRNTVQIDKDQIYYNLARSTYMLGKHDEALKHLDAISSEVKIPANIDYMYGIIFRDRGEKQKAHDYFQSCLKKAEGSSIEQYCRNQL